MKSLKEERIKTNFDILEYDTQQRCNDQPVPLLLLLSALCGGNDANGADGAIPISEEATSISKIIELICVCMNKKLVLPNHFTECLLCYVLTNSKLFLNFIGKRSPGGSYTYICNWLKEKSTEPLTFPNGLVKCVFDNSQKIGKTHLISSINSPNKCDYESTVDKF